MDPTREFITTNAFWDVEGLDTRLILDSTFQASKIQVEVLPVEKKAICKMQLQ
jgi:hypothetical protein